MRKNKIALVLVTEPELGGGHQYAMLLAECIKEAKERKYEIVSICSNTFWHRWSRANGIRSIRVSWPNPSVKQMNLENKNPIISMLYNRYFTEIGKYLRQEKVDLLLVTSQLLYCPDFGIKVILPVHDLMHRYESHFEEVRNEYEQREQILRLQAKYSKCILVDSKLGKEQFIESFGINKRKKQHIVSMPFIVPAHIYETQETFIDVPNKYIFYPAQFWKHKNHINLVKAIELLKSEITDIHLILVGSEKNCCKDIKRYIAEHGLKKYISILGFVSNENITYLYKHAIGMVMPSYFGPTNIPPLEAMALGCPVAVSNKYAMPEQVGKAGLLFNPDSPEEIAECIKILWDDDKKREELVELGYRKVNEWTKKEFKRKLNIIIDKCLSEK